jgi:hypothetical protein
MAVVQETSREQSERARLLGAQMEYKVVKLQPSTDFYFHGKYAEEPRMANDASVDNRLWTEGSQ